MVTGPTISREREGSRGGLQHQPEDGFEVEQPELCRAAPRPRPLPSATSQNEITGSKKGAIVNYDLQVRGSVTVQVGLYEAASGAQFAPHASECGSANEYKSLIAIDGNMICIDCAEIKGIDTHLKIRDVIGFVGAYTGIGNPS